MEIEEIQALWSEMSDQLETQKKLTNEIIMTMTQSRYSNKFNAITAYERIGTVICFAFAVYILMNISKLDTWYLMSCGVFTVGFLFLLPILVLRSLVNIKKLNIAKKSYKETLVSYTKAKTHVLRLQQFAIAMSFVLMFAVAAVLSKIWSNKDFFMVERGLTSYIVIVFAIAFVIIISRWGYRCYKGVINSAELVLKELD